MRSDRMTEYLEGRSMEGGITCTIDTTRDGQWLSARRCRRHARLKKREEGVKMSADVKQVIVVRRDLNMRKGKIAAQVAHASMKFLTDNNESERNDEVVVRLSLDEATWLMGSFTKVVVGIDSEDALRDMMLLAELRGIDVYPIIDSGRTEFHGVPTLTCAAFGPCESRDLDQITGNLKLL